MRSDGSGRYTTIYDFRIGQSVGLFGKNVAITGCDQYTREFYDNLGMPQNDNTEAPLDNFETRTRNKFVPKKDKLLNDFMEHKLGGGRVPSQKQFLENDRKVIIF